MFSSINCVTVSDLLILDVFHRPATKKVGSKVPLYKRSSSKQRSKMAAKKSDGKFKKDSVNRTNSKTVPGNSNFHPGKKRHFPTPRNSMKRKKRKT